MRLYVYSIAVVVGIGASSLWASAPCGADGQRACCITESLEPCRAGTSEVSGCKGADCACGGFNPLGVRASSHCEAIEACGGEHQRACCPNEGAQCALRLIALPGCGGNCLCDGSGLSQATCVRPTPCGQQGQRACSPKEFPRPCMSALVEVPGCSGDCMTSDGSVAHSMCSKMMPMEEPTTGYLGQTERRKSPLLGMLDMHLHLFGHMGHGGVVLTGQSFDPNGGVNVALQQDFGTDWDVVGKDGRDAKRPKCPAYLAVCGERALHEEHGLFEDMTGWGSHDGAASNLGAPIFSGWPTWKSTTHQQAYFTWLERAYLGGLRMVTMLAVTNEALCRMGHRLRGVDCTDAMAQVDAQLSEAEAFERYVDERSGGPGLGWFRIVKDPQAARAVIESGRMAVVLGIEVDNLFNCKLADAQNGRCTAQSIEEALDHYVARGVRHIFPVHDFDNAFGAPAVWQVSINVGNRATEGVWWQTEPCPSGYGYQFTLGVESAIRSAVMLLGGYGLVDRPAIDSLPSCHSRGLSSLGEVLVEMMMDRGLLIDIDHMSNKAFNDTLALAERRVPTYPVVASHVLPLEMQHEKVRSERLRTREQLKRIRDSGGMVALMLKDYAQDLDGFGKRLTHTYDSRLQDDCRHSSKSFAQSYRYLVDLMQGPIALGSDFNGIAAHLGPRFGSDACSGRDSPAVQRERSLQVRHSQRIPYPFMDPNFGLFAQQVTGEKVFDFNVDGLAHIGLLPDFVQDLRAIGLSEADLEPLLTSAEGYIRVWERALLASQRP